MLALLLGAVGDDVVVLGPVAEYLLAEESGHAHRRGALLGHGERRGRAALDAFAATR